MSTFVVKKRISLAFLGDGWEQGYITCTPFTYADNTELLRLRSKGQKLESEKEAEEASDALLSLIKDHFIEGQGYNGEKLIPITKDNISEMPMEIHNHIINTLQGTQIPPNVPPPSGR